MMATKTKMASTPSRSKMTKAGQKDAQPPEGPPLRDRMAMSKSIISSTLSASACTSCTDLPSIIAFFNLLN